MRKKWREGEKKNSGTKKKLKQILRFFCHLSQASQQEYQTQKHFFLSFFFF